VVAAVIVAIAIVLAVVTSGGSSKKSKVTSSTTAASSTTAPASTTTVAPLSPAALDATLTSRPAPATSAQCAANPAPPSSTTTIPAKGNAVSIVAAPKGIGFPKLDGSSPRYTTFSGPPPFCIDPTKTYTATMRTDAGNITIQLLPKYAPVTVNNFVFLAGYHYFDGTVFHRVIPGFVDQGGDPTGTGTGGPGYSFADELPKSTAAYDNGSFAMANSGPNTNGSQFFIVVGSGGQELTQAAYSMFGQVTSGLDVATKINNDGSSSGTPNTVHKILGVTIAVS
jgi:cyclophilin family peptidyl-prolyl cis-trans isomerase